MSDSSLTKNNKRKKSNKKYVYIYILKKSDKGIEQEKAIGDYYQVSFDASYIDYYTYVPFSDRPKLLMLEAKLKPGDQVYFYDVFHMGKDEEECLRLYSQFIQKEVSIFFCRQPFLNSTVLTVPFNTVTSTAKSDRGVIEEKLIKFSNDVIKNILISVFEYRDKSNAKISKKTSEGIERAKTQGKHIGRTLGKKYVSKKEVNALGLVKMYRTNYKEKYNATVLSKELHVSLPTARKYMKKVEEMASETL